MACRCDVLALWLFIHPGKELQVQEWQVSSHAHMTHMKASPSTPLHTFAAPYTDRLCPASILQAQETSSQSCIDNQAKQGLCLGVLIPEVPVILQEYEKTDAAVLF